MNLDTVYLEFYFILQTWQEFECITKIFKPCINYICNVPCHQEHKTVIAEVPFLMWAFCYNKRSSSLP